MNFPSNGLLLYFPKNMLFESFEEWNYLFKKKKKVLRQISLDQNMGEKANQRKIFCYDSKRCIQTFELYSVILYRTLAVVL